MASEESSIAVNFGKPIPLFPLEHVTLLPQQLLPLHIFEPRYVQMVERALDGSGLIAMAVFDGNEWKQNYHGRPRLKRAVCVGHMLRHSKLTDSRYNILLQGVCRARLLEESAPETGRLYRQATLEPVGVSALGESQPDMLDADLKQVRGRLHDLFGEGELSRLNASEQLLHFIANDDIPTHAVLEIVSFTLVQCPRLRYALLAEGSLARRAGLVLAELEHLGGLIRRARGQNPEQWPKGLSWN
ncbi:MAG: LON peptidase substrate-binding domain-containing protein [Phycisphaerales bacterium]